MKKFFAVLMISAAVLSRAQAAACPEANHDGCYSDGYGIVEVEPNIHTPHNQMEAAHWVGYKTKKHHRHPRRRVHRSCR